MVLKRKSPKHLAERLPCQDLLIPSSPCSPSAKTAVISSSTSSWFHIFAIAYLGFFTSSSLRWPLLLAEFNESLSGPSLDVSP